jgi:2-keto-4-pentenoate hydratase
MIDNGRDALPDTGAMHLRTSEPDVAVADPAAGVALFAARAFVGARRAATGLPSYPGTVPDSFAKAYAIQSHAIRLFDEPIGGWKVGRVHEPQASAFGTTRLAGPIFARSIVHVTQDTVVEMPVFADGFAAVEAEMLLRVAQPADNPASLSDAGILALIDAVHVGIEVASSPFPGINELGPLVTASDFGNNAGLVVGPALPDWRDRDLARLHASMTINGIKQGEGDMSGLPGGPIESVRFLLSNLAERNLAGGEPLWVSAGAISGVHAILPDSEAEACFDKQWTVRCRTRAATAVATT